MTTLDGVGHGTTLAGRYRLEERLHASGGSTLWRAVDTMLDRPVAVRIVPADSEGGGFAADDIVDAARRASLVDDPRLLRLLDVGTEDAAGDEITYVISELVAGDTLATRLVQRGPMPAAQVRALVGEAAQALQRAGSAGLHHRRLTPARVVIARDGSVKVAGVGIDAALEGDDDGVHGGGADDGVGG